MAKFYSLAFVSLLLLALGSCQSLEQISIDYMQPGDMTFPSQLRKVAIVNNTSNTPDNKLIYNHINQSKSNKYPIWRTIRPFPVLNKDE